jgi:thioesterase domain-containing protein/acyl carrier protein
MIPAAFVTMPELPLTPNGKIDRRALPLPGLSPLSSLSIDEGFPARQSVPPGTPLEVQLARIWEQVLGIKIASVRDNFFDLGGHSLLAVQMFAQIEKVFNIRLPLATLYEAPAIEGIAGILERKAASSRWSSLVEIQSSGSRPPFFGFHGEGGNVLIYRKLAQYLGADQPFYGLQSQGLDGNSPLLKTIDEMAALYVKEIRGVQPHGPYFLGGYCLGGTIAYEAAQQLHAADEEVALLALFDTMNWHKVPMTGWDKGFTRLQRLIFHAAVLLKIDAAGKRKFLKANHEAAGNYVPRPYPGAVTDFRPARQYRVLSKPDLKWDRLAAGGQRVVIIPGYPAVMLLEPYVKDLAAMLSACIDEAINQSKSTRPEGIPVAAHHSIR